MLYVWGKLPTSPFRVPYSFDVHAWEDFDGERHRGQPSDPEDAAGEFVHVSDPDTGDEHWFWAFTYQPFESWEEWYVYIEALMDQYGMELA